MYDDTSTSLLLAYHVASVCPGVCQTVAKQKPNAMHNTVRKSGYACYLALRVHLSKHEIVANNNDNKIYLPLLASYVCISRKRL